MSSSKTVISTLPIRSGTSIEDESSQPGKLWRDYICTIGVQSGFQRVYWGRQVENENVVDLFVGEYENIQHLLSFSSLLNRPVDSAYSDWNSFQDYESSIIAATTTTLSSILDPDIQARTFHTHFSPQTPSSNQGEEPAVVAEIYIFYFTSNLSSDKRSSWENAMAALIDALQNHAEGYKNNSTGWVDGSIENRIVAGDVTAYVAVIEWESVERHIAFRETEAFKKVIGPLRKATTGAELHHVVFRQLDKNSL